MKKPIALLSALALLSAPLLISGCNGSSGSSSPTDTPAEVQPPPDEDFSDDESEGRVFFIPAPDNAEAIANLNNDASEGNADDAETRALIDDYDPTDLMVRYMVQLRPGDVLEFDCGYYDISQSLLIQQAEAVTIKGCGIDKTVLSFKESGNATGVDVVDSRGITVKDLTVLDSPGDAFKFKGVKWGTLRRVRAIWSGGGEQITADNYAANDHQLMHVQCTKPPMNEGDPTPDYVPSRASGRYGVYPVQSENILVEDVESIGASDAGIYVGQTNTAIIRNSRAAYNVMGFEIENVNGGEYDSNLAECNVGGFLVYDLENLTQYGNTSIMHDNISRNNNTYNFANSGMVSMVPRGTGFITLGYDNLEVYDNLFEDNSTSGFEYVSYELLDGKDATADKKLDPYTEGLHIHNNTFRNNGYSLPTPDLASVGEGDIASLLPLVIGLKNLPELPGSLQLDLNDPVGSITDLLTGLPGTVTGLPDTLASLQNITNLGKGAHIVWDGLRDDLSDCPYPVDIDGNPVAKDASGKPILTDRVPMPDCHYNAYKFNDQGERILPQWGSCMHDNRFEGEGVDYLNFHGRSGLELVELLLDQDPSKLADVPGGLLNLASSRDMAGEQDCQALYGKTLAPLPAVVIPEFELSGDALPSANEETTRKLCEAELAEGKINWSAAASVDCPLLSQYNLFAEKGEPRSMPNEGGMPYVLNDKLFADYSAKWRVLFMPEGTSAVYEDGQQGRNLNGTLNFPVGTVIAKTFAFTKGASERLIETRLIIKRDGVNGKATWVGLPYIWGDDGEAHLTPEGGVTEVSWDYLDSVTNERQVGSTDHYSVPNSNQCITCHANNDRAGSAPIGPKVRNLNRPYAPDSNFMGNSGQGGFVMANQLQYMVDNNLLTGAPDLKVVDGIATGVEHVAQWNVPGSGGEVANSNADVEQRLRAYLESNCQHCHNDGGAASNTGLYLDHFRDVDANYGICKTPTATGGGSCQRKFVIVPGHPEQSIISCRVHAELHGDDATNGPEKMMPPIARSVAHQQAADLLDQWITKLPETHGFADSCN